MPALEDRIQALNAEIQTKEDERSRAWQEFDEKRNALANSDADITDDSTPEWQAVHEAHRAYGELSDGLKDLADTRERLWMLTTERNGGAGAPAGLAGAGAAGAREAIKDLAHSRYSPGDRIVASAAYKEAREQGVFRSAGDKLGGRVVLGDMYESTEEFVASLRPNASVIVTDPDGDDTVRPFILPDQRGLVEPRFRPLLMRDLITVGQTSTDSVEWVIETGYVNNAAAVPEATTDAPIAGGVTPLLGGVKPQSRLAYEKRQTAVSTIAHWVAATKRSLDDVPRLRTIVDTRLRRGLDDVLEDMIVAGDGEGDNLLGILSTEGIQYQPNDGVFLEDVLRGMTRVQLAFFQVQATAVNPLDWQDIRLSRDDSGAGAGTGQYLFGPPSQAGATTLWGYPVVSGPQIPSGTAITGDFRTVELLIREGVTVTATDSHADFFVRNLVAVLAETRAALVTPQPEAICEVGGTPPS